MSQNFDFLEPINKFSEVRGFSFPFLYFLSNQTDKVFSKWNTQEQKKKKKKDLSY
jgi:hypothetical protein